MSVVSNSSPLIHFARIGQLDLLRKLYGEIVIPDAVWDEIVVKGVGQSGSEEIAKSEWIKRLPVSDRKLVRALQRDLDIGEAEAIVLALEIGAKLLLIDDRIGRQIARHLGIRCIGTIGVLVEAKAKGLILLLKPFLDVLRSLGFYCSDELYNRVLRDVGEL